MEVSDLVCNPRAAPAVSKGKPSKPNEVQDRPDFKDSLDKQVSKDERKMDDPQSVQEKPAPKKQVTNVAGYVNVIVLVPETRTAAEVISNVSQEIADAAGASIKQAVEASPMPENPLQGVMTAQNESVLAEATSPELAVALEPEFSVEVKSEKAPEANPENMKAAQAVIDGAVVSEVKVASPVEPENPITKPAVPESDLPLENMVQKADVAQVGKPEISAKAEVHAPGRIISQVVHTVKSMFENGQKVITLNIQPEELGQVNVRLTTGTDGLKVIISADRSSTGELLENSIRQLQDKLAASGIEVGEMSIGYYQQQNPQNQEEWSYKGVPLNSVIRTQKIDETDKSLNWGASRRASETALDFMA